MATVFISYSRKDIEFAKRLTTELQQCELDFWIDWEGIPPTVDWWMEIKKSIEESDVFLFLISPDSVDSPVCRDEIDHALRNGKRIVPLMIRDTKNSDVPLALRRLNWIFFHNETDFDASVTRLLSAVHTDYEWVKIHRRLQVKALEWERHNNENSFLLRGIDLESAEQQIAVNITKEPYPTELQQRYVGASRLAANQQQRRSRIWSSTISAIGLVLLSIILLALAGELNPIIYQPVDMDDYWVNIPAGEFLMGSETGSESEKPVHSVYLDALEIGRYEVTNRQYNQCIRSGTCFGSIDNSDLSFPRVNISWEDAQTYCTWVDGRLPTEAEWEKAARGGLAGKTFPWGDEPPSCTKGSKNGANNFGVAGCPIGLIQVGSYAPNGYGLYDMAGNVSEWVNDYFAEHYYEKSPSQNPPGPAQADVEGIRTLRGGSWLDDVDGQRVARRSMYAFSAFSNLTGFRCARDAEE